MKSSKVADGRSAWRKSSVKGALGDSVTRSATAQAGWGVPKSGR